MSLYKQTFQTFPNENLKKTFASYLSTSTGPVAGPLQFSCSFQSMSKSLPNYISTPIEVSGVPPKPVVASNYLSFDLISFIGLQLLLGVLLFFAQL